MKSPLRRAERRGAGHYKFCLSKTGGKELTFPPVFGADGEICALGGDAVLCGVLRINRRTAVTVRALHMRSLISQCANSGYPLFAERHCSSENSGYPLFCRRSKPPTCAIF